MFDVSFSELILILVVGLVVFGPEKLPEVIRTATLWVAKIKHTFVHMRSEIEREIGVDEIKRDMHNSSVMQKLRDVQGDLQRTQQELRNLPYDVSDVVQRANNTDPTIHLDPTGRSDSGSSAASNVDSAFAPIAVVDAPQMVEASQVVETRSSAINPDNSSASK